MGNTLDLYEVISHESGRNDQEPAFFYHSDHLGSAAYLTNDAGQVTQTLNYLPYGEDWVDIQNYAETRYPRLGIYSNNGKEKDYESGFHYYGARYYWSEILTEWLSVDPMADKYPSISPYAYCIWNPVKLVDPDGNEAGIPPTWVRTGWFALRHPQIASAIGSCRPGEMNTNISTRSERFATRGSSYSSQGTIFRSNGCTEDSDPCSEIGAFRHTLWQATIASYYGRDIATQVGNAHEDNPNANLKARRFSSMAEADQVVDLLNNMLGRTIGEQNPNCPMNELAGKVLESFYKTGLYTGSLNEDGSWSVSRTKITKEQYGRRGNFPWMPHTATNRHLTKYLGTTEHEKGQVIDPMHLGTQPLHL